MSFFGKESEAGMTPEEFANAVLPDAGISDNATAQASHEAGKEAIVRGLEGGRGVTQSLRDAQEDMSNEWNH